MAITYPLSLPASDLIETIELRPSNIVGVYASPWTGEQQVQGHPGEFWVATVSTPSLFEREADEWRAFVTALRGRLGTFLMGDPAKTVPDGANSGTPVVDGASQTGFELATRGWDANTTGVLLEGDYIQLGTGSDSRLHVLTADASSNASGEATLDLWPRLRSSPSDGDTVITTDTVGRWRLVDNAVGWRWVPPARTSIQFSCREAL